MSDIVPSRPEFTVLTMAVAALLRSHLRQCADPDVEAARMRQEIETVLAPFHDVPPAQRDPLHAIVTSIFKATPADA